VADETQSLPPENLTAPQDKTVSPSHSIAALRFLIWIAFSTLVFMSAYELFKGWLYPHNLPWQLRLLTVAFSVGFATLGAYVILYRIDHSYRHIAAELYQKEHASLVLESAQLALEQEVAERTGELADANLRLEKEISERQQAEENLRRERDFAESLIATAQVIILILDPEGRILRVNPYFETISGYAFDEIKLKHWESTFLPERERARIHEVFQKTLADHQSKGIVNPILTQSGQERSIEWYNCTLYDTEGVLLGVLAVGHDITEQRKVEAILRKAHDESEQQVRERTRELERRVTQLAILNDVGSKIAAILDLEHVFNRVTTLVQENFGYHHVGLFTLDHASDSLVMQARAGAFDPLFPPQHILKVGQGMVGWVGKYSKTRLANDVSAEPQYVNLYPDVIPTQSELSVPIRLAGEIVGVLDIQSPELNAFDDSDVMVMETLADQVAVAIANSRLYQTVQHELNERRQAEAALRESEARYHTVSDLISDVAYAATVHSNGTLSPDWVAGSFTNVPGLDFSDPEKQPAWEEVIHPDDMQTLQEAFETLMACQPYECDLRLIDQSGNIRWLHTRNHPVWDGDEKRVVRIIGAAQDITEQKKMERLMLRAERMAAMGHITGTLAHEIKNPLQAINSNLELVLDFPLEPDERIESLQVCRREVERLTDITQSVLSLAHFDKSRYREINLVILVEQTLELLRNSLSKASVQAATRLETEWPVVLGDEDQIRQVLLNLVLNAVEAMPNGGDLEISGRTIATSLVVTLTNNGPPIPQDIIDHIFEPFFTTKPGGAGLGLYISHHIIQQHDGDLSVRNLEDDQGVCFTLTLPLAKSLTHQEMPKL